MQLAFSLVDWFALSKERTCRNDWLTFARNEATSRDDSPAMPKRLPMMLSRRMSPASAMPLNARLSFWRTTQLTPLSVRAVMRKQQSLVALANGQEPFPTDFTMSVHNAASGLLTIFQKLRVPVTSVAAEANTFEAAL